MSNDWPGQDDDLDFALSDAALQKLLDQPSSVLQQSAAASSRSNLQHEGFDESTGDTWIYPSNMPMRSYQHNIAHTALYRNTLVVLPTGLGKTFIAAVVMYNIYRWFPQGKIIFMAPTRPLVSQQIAACQKIMPFPASDTVELTGKLPRAKRAELWANKRVFFVTPQVVQSDMIDPNGNGGVDGIQFPYASIKLLVVDEAHRAKGRYAYTQVTESLFARNPNFRVLALSATPGRNMEDVATVCRNLYISHVEVRCDNSIDVVQYVHQRTMRTIVVPLGESLKEPRARLLQIIDPYLRQLVAADVLGGALSNVNRNFLLFEQKRFQERAANGQRHPEHSAIASNFSMCISLYHGLELLERHGLRVFVNSFDEDEDGRQKFVLTRDFALQQLLAEMRQKLGPNPFNVSAQPMTNGQLAPMPTELDFGHPKYEQARKVLLDHFEAHPDSRAIVFCEYRESVMLIQRLLLQHKPLLRPRCFVGQGGTSGSIRALTQKQQMEIMTDFRSGSSNILVATSIGEEGIDVGEVELIVCFDICTSNPTRFVQRIGRTGRQKRGHVVMLATEGRERQILKDVLANRDQTNRKLMNSSIIKRALYDKSPRLVPPQYNPKCEKKFIEPQKITEQTTLPKGKTKSKNKREEPFSNFRTKVKSHDLRKFFHQTEPPPLDTQERLYFEQEGIPLPKPYVMSEATQQQIKEACAQRDEGVKNFLQLSPLTQSPEPQPQKASTSSQEEVLRLRKLNRLLQASKPILTESQRKQDLTAQLQDKQLPQSLKLYLMQSNTNFVHEICEKMQRQQELELKAEKLNSRQQRTRRQYEVLLDIFGGKTELERLLQNAHGTSENDDLALLEGQVEVTKGDYKATFDKLFEGLDEQGLSYDNDELVEEEMQRLEQHKLEQTLKEQLSESRVYDGGTLSLIDWEDSTLHESCNNTHYDSQMLEFAPNTVQFESTPLRVREKAMTERSSTQQMEHLDHEPADTTGPSVIEDSKLSINLSKLNNLLSVQQMAAVAASTPITTRSKRDEKDHLLDGLNQDLSVFEKIARQTTAQSPISKQTVPPINVLDIDLNDFLEPLPEEKQLLALQTQKECTPSPSSKENRNNINCLTELADDHRFSPDLFAEESMSPWELTTPARAQPQSLAAKLAAKSVVPSKHINTSTILSSPKQRRRPELSSKDKSPSIFELYLQRTRGHDRMAKTAQSLHKITSTVTGGETVKSLPPADESAILKVRRRAKRKLIASDSEEETEVPATDLIRLCDDQNDCSDFEQVPATQMPNPPLPARASHKRHRFNPFIMEEAEKSGSDHDEDAEETIGCYIKDSIIVSSGDEEGNSHNDTTNHAMYLQAVRSPVQRLGAFKIPAPRNYIDDSDIFSQTQEPESSQYLPCSFIVDNDATGHETRDVSECALERAERILKEERRKKKLAKRRLASPNKNCDPPKRRRVLCVADSSSDEDLIVIN